MKWRRFAFAWLARLLLLVPLACVAWAAWKGWLADSRLNGDHVYRAAAMCFATLAAAGTFTWSLYLNARSRLCDLHLSRSVLIRATLGHSAGILVYLWFAVPDRIVGSDRLSFMATLAGCVLFAWLGYRLPGPATTKPLTISTGALIAHITELLGRRRKPPRLTIAIFDRFGPSAELVRWNYVILSRDLLERLTRPEIDVLIFRQLARGGGVFLYVVCLLYGMTYLHYHARIEFVAALALVEVASISFYLAWRQRRSNREPMALPPNPHGEGVYTLPVPTQVEAFLDGFPEETPKRFHADSELRLVDTILEKGARPGGRYYRVRADNGRDYTLWRESGWFEGRWLLDPPPIA